MFDKNDIDKIDFADAELSAYEGLYTIYYKPFAFETETEESIRISIAPKAETDNGAFFWLASELQDDWSDRMEYFEPYIKGADYTPVSEEEFSSMVENQCAHLYLPPELPLVKGNFKGALAMCTLEDEMIVDLFAEYEGCYVHFFWESVD